MQSILIVKGRVAPRVLSSVKVQIGTKNFIEVEIRTIRSVKSTILSSTEAWPIQGHCDVATNTFGCFFSFVLLFLQFLELSIASLGAVNPHNIFKQIPQNDFDI